MKIKNIHENIKKYRLQNDWSQETLAEKCGVDRSIISKWEKRIEGRTPDLDMLIKLTNLFDCTIDELVFGEKETIYDLPNNIEEQIMNILNQIDYNKKAANSSQRESVWEQYKLLESSYDFTVGGNAEVLTDIGFLKLDEYKLIEAKNYFEAALIGGDLDAYVPLFHIWGDLLTIAESSESSTEDWLFSNLRNISDFSEIAREILYTIYNAEQTL